jgi:glycosyltransferase involved in cell wall biosynthesis
MSAEYRILVLTPRFPYPLKAGDTLRIYHICRALSKKYSITLLSLCGTKEKVKREPKENVFDQIYRVHHTRWQAWLQTAAAFFSGKPLQVAYYHSKKFAQKVDDLASQHDLILSHLCRTAQYTEGREGVPTVLEMTDALSLNYERVREHSPWGLKQWLYYLEGPRMKKYEKKTLDHFDLISLVSPKDREFLLRERSEEKNQHVRVYTNGIDLSARPYQGPGSAPVIVFIGNMRTVHNRIACQFVIDEILPRVRPEIPDIRFRIVGAAPSGTQETFNRIEGVTVTGWVDSIPEATKDAFCGIGVMKVAGGLQNKILEYMALGLPVVANKMGVEGIGVTPGHDVLIGEDPEEIVNHVISFYEKKYMRVRLAESARTFVETNHQWSTALTPFVDDISQLLS